MGPEIIIISFMIFAFLLGLVATVSIGVSSFQDLKSNKKDFPAWVFLAYATIQSGALMGILYILIVEFIKHI